MYCITHCKLIAIRKYVRFGQVICNMMNFSFCKRATKPTVGPTTLFFVTFELLAVILFLLCMPSCGFSCSLCYFNSTEYSRSKNLILRLRSNKAWSFKAYICLQPGEVLASLPNLLQTAAPCLRIHNLRKAQLPYHPQRYQVLYHFLGTKQFL